MNHWDFDIWCGPFWNFNTVFVIKEGIWPNATGCEAELRSVQSEHARILVPYACVGGIGRVIWHPISRAALGPCCGGANNWASRPELLFVNTPAEKEWVHGEFHSSTQALACSHIHNSFRSLLWYNEAPRCRPTASGHWALKMLAPCCLCVLF